jgi:iron complex outermembrane recepter protein
MLLASGVVRRLIVAASGILILTLTRSVIAQTATFNLPAEDAVVSIPEFARQAGLQIIAPAAQLKGIRTQRLQGSMDVHAALKVLLQGTGLTVASDDGKTIGLKSQGPTYSKPGPTSSPQSQSENSSVVEPAASDRLDEVLVTAEKKSERAETVPIPVTALNAETLADSGEVRLQDYFSSIPGLSVTPNAQSQQLISIRGITTGVANPTVGITIDGVAFGSSTNAGGGASVPDIDPSDLASIEVLRGPQGALYGASSMGGLINFVTLNPTTDTLSGRVQASTEDIYNGDGPGYTFRGSVNVPVGDTLAVRASAFTREDPGYIDNPILGVDGINEVRSSGGLLAALWRPTDAVSLKVSALYQETHGNGLNDVDIEPGLGDLQQSYPPGVGPYTKNVQAYSATLTAKVGAVELTSVSGYNVNAFTDSWDFSQDFGQMTAAMYGVSGSPEFDRNKTKKITQELRLSGLIGERLEWLLGGFYAHEDSAYSQALLAENVTTGEILAQSYLSSFPSTYRELAAFGDLTVHLTEQFDVQFGGRESQIKEGTSTSGTAALFGAPEFESTPDIDNTEHAFTYLLTPRYMISTDLMVYGRLASGYRAGGSNSSPGFGTPAQYDPDKTQNYEIGTKAELLEHTLSLDASVYYINWQDLQVSLINPQTYQSYIANGGHARSDGIELSLQSKPLTGLTIAAWVALNDAKLTESFPMDSIAAGGAYGVSGDRLPYSSRFTGNISLEQDFPVASGTTAYVGAALSYVGDHEGLFQPLTDEEQTPRQYYPGYAKADLKSGIKLSAWTINLFVTNLTDKRGALTGGVDYVPTFAYQYIQPRTVGISVAKTF